MNADSKTGFRFDLRPMVLMLVANKCYISNNIQYIIYIFEIYHSFATSMRTIGRRTNLKPVLESAFNPAFIEIYKGNINIVLLKKLKK